MGHGGTVGMAALGAWRGPDAAAWCWIRPSATGRERAREVALNSRGCCRQGLALRRCLRYCRDRQLEGKGLEPPPPPRAGR